MGRSREVILERKEIFKAISLRGVENTQTLIQRHIEAGKNYIFSAVFSKTSH